MIARYAFNELLELHRGLGDPARLHPADRDHGVRDHGLLRRALRAAGGRAAGVPVRRRGRSSGVACHAHPRRGLQALRAGRVRRARRPRAADGDRRPRARAAAQPGGADRPGEPRRRAVARGPALRLHAHARGVHRRRRVLRAGGRGRGRAQGPQAADRRRACSPWSSPTSASRWWRPARCRSGTCGAAARTSTSTRRCSASAGLRRGVAARAAARTDRHRRSRSWCIACNAAMLGLSRLGYSLALNRQIPSAIGRLHPTRATPVVMIAVGALLAIAAADPGRPRAPGRDLRVRRDDLVHDRALSVIRLRWREPDRDRPFKIPLNVRVGRGELPVSAALGAVLSFAALRGVHRSCTATAAGRAPGWMASGSRSTSPTGSSEGKPILKRVTVPERALTRPGRQGRVRLDPRARARAPARRRHHADRRAAVRGGERRRGRGRRGDRGGVGVRGADGAADRRAGARRGPQARAQGARARQGGGGGVRGRRGRHRHRARAAAPARRSSARRSAAASRRSCWPRRSRRACAAGRCWAASGGCATRSWARRRATW